jgi:polyisoprenyl-phosphate glycosyltransferase
VAQHILAFGEIDRYYPGLRSWVGFEQKGIEVERNARYDEKPRVSLGGLFHLATTAMFSFSSFPLMIFHVIGAMAGIVFIALGGFAIFCRLFTDYAIPGWTSHILTGSFFGALNALGISILGEYVTRIYDQVRGRPQYIVDRTSNIHRERAPESIMREFDDIPDDEDAAYLDLMEEASELLREGTILNSNRDSKMNFNTSNTNSNAPINFDATAEPSMVVPFDDGY